MGRARSLSYLAASLVASVLAVAFLDAAVPYAFVYLGLIAGAALALLCGALRPDRLRASWLLLAAGVACTGAGDALWFLYELVLDIAPSPSFADVVYLGAYPLFAAGLLLRIRARTDGRDAASLVDALIVATGTGVLAWVFLMAPYATDPELTDLERIVSLAYPLADVLLVALVARLLFLPGRRRGADVLLTAGLTAVLVTDTVAGHLLLVDGYTDGGILDLGWLAGYICLGAAALWPPGAHPLEAPAATASRGRLALLACASLLAPALLTLHAVRADDVTLLVIAAGSAALFLLVVLRMEGMVRQIQRQAAELERMAATDGLTGLANRRQWDAELPRALARARRSGTSLCLALIDLDHFKRFNDQFGHLAGDDLLRGLALAWRPHLRPDDLLVRYGGEEFTLLLPDCEEPQALMILQRLRAATPMGQSFSAGVTVWDGSGQAQDLMARADDALYEAKRAGRARTIMAPA